VITHVLDTSAILAHYLRESGAEDVNAIYPKGRKHQEFHWSLSSNCAGVYLSWKTTAGDNSPAGRISDFSEIQPFLLLLLLLIEPGGSVVQ
jgi:hypothetical protein